jgi:hypothetical protein
VWTVGDLEEWFAMYLVEPGFMKRPRCVREPGTAPVPLDSRVDAVASLGDVLSSARLRVIAAVRGLLAPVADDRFLNAAIFGGRVRRAVVAGSPVWVPSPRETDFLGEIVLSLFAADILPDRDFYRAHLCFCDVCDQLAFNGRRPAASLCARHYRHTSGIIRAR